MKKIQICKDLKENFNETPRCEECTKCLELNVYQPDDVNSEIQKVLDKYSVNKVCLAFNYKNIAIIGKFSGVGCEEFVSKIKPKNKDSNKIIGSLSLQKTLEIWNAIQTKPKNKTNTQLIKELGIASATFYRIKNCEGKYKFLCKKNKYK